MVPEVEMPSASEGDAVASTAVAISNANGYGKVPFTDEGDEEANEFHPLPLPVEATLAPSKSLLKKVDADGSTRKKYKTNLRVIRFALDEGIVEGGLEEGDPVVTVSSYEDALAVADSTPSRDEIDSSNAEAVVLASDTNPTVPLATLSSTVSPIASRKVGTVPKSGILTKEQEVLAMTSLAHGHVLDAARDIIMHVAKNPVNVHGRTLHMFTSGDKMHGGEEKSDSDEDGDQSSRSVGIDIGGGKKSSFGDDMTMSRCAGGLKKMEPRDRSANMDRQVTFSGWLLSGIYSLELSVKPIETICMNMRAWVECVTDVEHALYVSWAPNLLVMELLVDTTTWAIAGTKCSACAVGIVRQHSHSRFEDETLRGLCLCCMARKTLYERVVRAQPRFSRKRFMMTWPFHVEQPVDICRNSVVETTLVMREEYAPDPFPAKQQSDEPVKPKVFIKRGDSYNLQAILRKAEIDRKKEAGDEDSSIFTTSTMLSSVSMDTYTTKSSSADEDISMYGPRELAMLPLLLSRRNFDEAERILRVCIVRREYAGEEGVLFVARLMQVQAEMYQMLGLPVLALGLFMDAADMIVSRLGFDSVESLQAFGAVESLLRRMGLQHAEETFSRSVKSRLEKHFTSSRKAALSSSYLDDRRHVTTRFADVPR